MWRRPPCFGEPDPRSPGRSPSPTTSSQAHTFHRSVVPVSVPVPVVPATVVVVVRVDALAAARLDHADDPCVVVVVQVRAVDLERSEALAAVRVPVHVAG